MTENHQEEIGGEPADLIGQTVGRYEVLGHIGKGSMGSLYKARDIERDQEVALKVLSRKLVFSDRPWYERLVREVEAISKLRHPNIVQGLGCGRQGNVYFLAMEFVNGKPLSDLLRRHGKLPERTSLSIALQVAKALDHACRQNLVHRDVKPQNILVLDNGHVKVTDFGLVKFVGDADQAERAARRKQESDFRTPPVLVVGTPRYLSPEQARRSPNVDTRADIYSLGLVLFTMLTGRFPFTGAPVEIVLKQMNEPVPDCRSLNPDVSLKTAQAVSKMTAKQPEERYQTPTPLIVDLTACLLECLKRKKGKPLASPAAHSEDSTMETSEQEILEESTSSAALQAVAAQAESQRRLFCVTLATNQRFFFEVRDNSEVYIGRDIVSSEVVVPDQLVSKVHCLIESREGIYRVSDCGSINGTYVNGNRIITTDLMKGDVVRIGRSEILVP